MWASKIESSIVSGVRCPWEDSGGGVTVSSAIDPRRRDFRCLLWEHQPNKQKQRNGMSVWNERGGKEVHPEHAGTLILRWSPTQNDWVTF